MTGEMSQAEVTGATGRANFPTHYAVIDALRRVYRVGARLMPFDHYQGPYIYIYDTIGTVHNRALPMWGKYWLVSDDDGTCHWWDQNRDSKSEAFIPEDEDAAVDRFIEFVRPVPVMFRVSRNDSSDVYALFPDQAGTVGDPGSCTCYQHVGQHSAADYRGCINSSRPATPDEYLSLKKELERAPYHYRLHVVSRQTSAHRHSIREQLRPQRTSAANA